MFAKRSIFRMFSILLVLLLMSGIASARPLEAPLGTGFTYQGKLTDGGTPANGVYDFEFKLYDALSGGSPLGTVPRGDVTVANGLFTVQLDFGNVFDGTALYLEIGVRQLAFGEYTVLTPRQQLSAAPYALYALEAPWNGLTGVPTGFADGVDNDAAYQNVVIVAQSGGDFTTITAALDSIQTASDVNGFLIHVAPGVYTEKVIMKPFVDIEGSGELTTRITFSGSVSEYTGTVQGANDAELRYLTVDNTGGDTYAIAIYNNSAAPRLTHVTASAAGGTVESLGVYNVVHSSPKMMNVTASGDGAMFNYGVINDDSSSPTMTDVSASASGGTYNYGVYNGNSGPTMTGVTASAWAGTTSPGTTSYGVYNTSSSSPTMTDVTASALGGTHCIGVFNTVDSSPRMTNVTASASGGTSDNIGVYNYENYSISMTGVSARGLGGDFSYGVYNYRSSLTINNSYISAVGSGERYGIFNIDYTSGGYYTVRVNNSQINGNTATIRNDAEFTTRVGASQLSGGDVTGGGTVMCIGVYDENFISPDYNTCP